MVIPIIVMHIHFIGIGGIGVSALAKYYMSHGAHVSGSDLVLSEITEELKILGAKIFVGKHKKSNLLKAVEKVIYTSAVCKDNPELEEARKRHIKIQSYAEAVGELTQKYKTITISGAHGKSTTTALAALVLEEGYFDPTVIVGTKIKEFGNSNFREGHGGYLVLEADEWNKSFLKYHPKIAIVTNIDAEHLDTYRTVEGVEKAFSLYLSRVPKDGAIIANFDSERLRRIAKKFGRLVFGYSLQDKEAEKIAKVLRLPGKHNISNALAAYRLGKLLGVDEGHILHAISGFSGAWRRFEFKGKLNGASIFSDYGHHPAEIHATILAARERFPFRRVWCVYQPHQYQRLSYLWEEFVSAFDMADRVCLLPVYDVAGRETKKAKDRVNSKELTHELLRRGKDALHFDSFADAQKFITENARPGDIILIMGAGDIYTLANQLHQ